MTERGMALLDRWLGERGLDAATGKAGGNSEALRTLRETLLEVIHEGGAGTYAVKLDVRHRETSGDGGEVHADVIERLDGIVEQVSPGLIVRGWSAARLRGD